MERGRRGVGEATDKWIFPGWQEPVEQGRVEMGERLSKQEQEPGWALAGIQENWIKRRSRSVRILIFQMQAGNQLMPGRVVCWGLSSGLRA